MRRDEYDINYQNRQYRNGGSARGTMRRRRVSKKQKRREVLHVILPPLIAIILIVIVAAVALTSGALDSLKYSSKKADLYSYFNIADDSQAVVVRYGEATEERVPIINGVPYIELSTVNDEFNGRFYYDTESDSYLYTRADKSDSARVGDRTITFDGSSSTVGYDPYVVEGDTVYMALDYLKLYKDIDYRLCGGDGEPYRIWMSDAETDTGITIVPLKKKQAVRTAEDKKSEILKELNAGDTVILLQKGDEWSKVTTDDFLVGYIENKFLDNAGAGEELKTGGSVIPLNIPQTSLGEPVVLAWHNVTNNSGADDIASILNSSPGINVISPTWFTVTDDDANIDSIGSKDYVDICHSAGVKVWALFDNLQHLEVSSFEIFSKASKRDKLISQLIAYAHEYGIDGINIDVESIPVESGEHFMQFIRELSIKCRENGLILSVDNYVPMDYNDHYNRAEQGVYADYVIIMGYDEHYSGSLTAGSVASIGYVRSGIENTVSMVPNEKIINAVPLYTRIWVETPKTDEEIEEDRVKYDDQGNEIPVPEEDIVPYKLEVQTVRMSEGIEAARANAEVVWDEETAQNYATWTKGDKTYEVWLEDRDSLEAKLKVMQENNLAGVAAWQVKFADDYVWDLFSSYYGN
ncbi:MAG: SH3 domain-containing protein [Lachnospiraceae bacterium]|nr:SH3 domain-containing protein [Lachnospiraceae bacterium]